MYKNYFLAFLIACVVAMAPAATFATADTTLHNSDSEQIAPSDATTTTEPTETTPSTQEDVTQPSETPVEPSEPEQPTQPVQPEAPDSPTLDAPVQPETNITVGGGQNSDSEPSHIGTITLGTGKKEDTSSSQTSLALQQSNPAPAMQPDTTKPASTQSTVKPTHVSASAKPNATTGNVSSEEPQVPTSETSEIDAPEVEIPLTGMIADTARPTSPVMATILLAIGAAALSLGVVVMVADKLKND